MEVEKSYTPIFISSPEVAAKHGIGFKKSLENALVYKEEPDILLAYNKGHVILTADGVGIAPGMETYNVYFKDQSAMDDLIFAHSPEAAVMLLEAMYDLDLVESMEREQTERTIVWCNGGRV